ncbi:peptidylprolyl isomerase [Deinococcus roseus]|uniref:Peptidyl-prolyl cis-trans isomerase n=1 Tax=Deinococcus roseus TaxID=392414 RepID=A0ABQ2D052_9DEIO|nr:peptidylprolyl isomerase [Deinococcus roseus]GGJ38199.1 peptidyl-prolyl cis-trans isomerase [Deinococcus roseus]
MSDIYIPQGYALTPELSSERKTRFNQAPELGDGIEPGKQYKAVFETNKGRLVIDLYADQVPVTVNNFVYLLRNHYYDGIVFHRVLEDFMAQTGDPTGTGSGGPGYNFEDEFDRDLRHRGKGVLSMANRGPNTNGSQLFITFVDTPWLDGKHAVFGRVSEGLDVLDRLQRIDPMRPSKEIQPDVIEKAYVVEKSS